MNPRALPILNAIGCLALTGLVLVQWRQERAINGALAGVSAELAISRGQTAEANHHGLALERDIAVLKESIAATQQAAEALARSLAGKDQQLTRLQAELTAAAAQAAAWQAAITARDERLRALDADLTASRRRLDEALARLKAAAAR